MRWETIHGLVASSKDFLSACTPGYYNNEGDTSSIGIFDQIYTPGINQFNAMLAEWREKGDLRRDCDCTEVINSIVANTSLRLRLDKNEYGIFQLTIHAKGAPDEPTFGATPRTRIFRWGP